MKHFATFALLSILAGAAHAEQQFISDKLVVNVYAEANQDSEKIATLDSGDAVEIVEKSEGFTRVKLADGGEGWVKSSYLVAQMPAVARLKELEKERGAPAVPAATTEEIKRLKEQNTALQSELASARQVAAQAATQVATQTEAQLAARASAKAEQPKSAVIVPSNSDSTDAATLHAWKWSAGIALAAVTIGFLLGYRTIAKKIERKYGNLKIY